LAQKLRNFPSAISGGGTIPVTKKKIKLNLSNAGTLTKEKPYSRYQKDSPKSNTYTMKLKK